MKKSILLGIAALSVFGMVACNSNVNVTIGDDESQSSISSNTETDTVESEFTEEGNVAKYENCTNLRMPYQMEELNLIGKIACVSDDGMILTTDYELRTGYGTFDEVMFQTSDDFRDFYLTYDLDTLSINTDGSYSYYPFYGEGTEIRFRVDEGEIIQCGKLTSKEICAIVRIEDKLIAHIINPETGEIVETIDNFIIQHASSGDEISVEFDQLLYHPGTHIVYITDSEGNLRGTSGSIDIEYWSYNPDKSDENVISLNIPDSIVTDIDRLLGSDSLCNVVYSKTTDSNHIYLMDGLNFETLEYEELVYDLPDGYTTADIDSVIIGSNTNLYNSVLIFNDQSVYALNRGSNETKKLEELSVLNQEGHVLEFGSYAGSAIVLMDDNTVYQIINY